jgi:hypothetical protein
MENKRSVFEILNEINVNDHTEQKNGLTYLSWAWAWGTLKKHFPDATYTVYENAQGLNYHTDGRTCWVKTGVTVEGIENIEYLPVMDFKNRSIPADQVTSFDVNKAIQRSLTKAVARHGLGLYIYAGEDLPENLDAPLEAPKPEYDRKAAELACFTALGLNRANREDVQSFGQMVKSLKAGKVIPEKTLTEMTDEEHKAALAAMVANYGDR